jgi:pre-mRNA-splicing helicase BRR2
VSALRNSSFEKLYPSFNTFNAIQTQVHNTLYNTSENTLISSPAGSGKTVCAEFAMLRMFNENPNGRCVYVAPFASLVNHRLADWTKRFAEVSSNVRVAALTGETSADLKILERNNVILSTPENWDMLSRRWKQRKNVQTVALFIVDEMHLIGGEQGPIIEVTTSRMRYISSQTDNKTRIVALCSSVANAKDLGDWIGASSHSLYNFHPNVRPIPLEIHIQGIDIPHYASRMLAMSKPMYSAITSHSPNKPVIIYTSDRKHCRITAFDIIAYAAVEDSPDRFLHCNAEDIEPFVNKLKEKILRESVPHGVGMLYEGMHDSDRDLVMHLFRSNAIQVLVAAKTMCWSVFSNTHLVIIMGTESYDGKEHRYVDYPITDVLQMMGRAGRYGEDTVGKAVILCHTPKKEKFKRFLNEPVPVESHLDHSLHDHMSAEIVTKVIENKQEAVDYLTWTFYYRRLTQNPNYYNMTGTTHRHISDHLSELVETLVTDLEQSKCISIEDDQSGDVSALNLG